MEKHNERIRRKRFASVPEEAPVKIPVEALLSVSRQEVGALKAYIAEQEYVIASLKSRIEALEAMGQDEREELKRVEKETAARVKRETLYVQMRTQVRNLIMRARKDRILIDTLLCRLAAEGRMSESQYQDLVRMLGPSVDILSRLKAEDSRVSNALCEG